MITFERFKSSEANCSWRLTGSILNIYQIKFWTERSLVNGEHTRESNGETSVRGKEREYVRNESEFLIFHSYRKGLGSLSHYPGPVGLRALCQGSLSSLGDGFPAPLLPVFTKPLGHRWLLDNIRLPVSYKSWPVLISSYINWIFLAQ